MQKLNVFTTLYILIFLIIALVVAIAEASRVKKFAFLLIKKRGVKVDKMSIPFISDLIGREVKVITVGKSYKGKIDELQGDWVKIVSESKKGLNEFFVKEDMITGIIVKP